MLTGDSAHVFLAGKRTHMFVVCGFMVRAHATIQQARTRNPKAAVALDPPTAEVSEVKGAHCRGRCYLHAWTHGPMKHLHA